GPSGAGCWGRWTERTKRARGHVVLQGHAGCCDDVAGGSDLGPIYSGPTGNRGRKRPGRRQNDFTPVTFEDKFVRAALVLDPDRFGPGRPVHEVVGLMRPCAVRVLDGAPLLELRAGRRCPRD